MVDNRDLQEIKDNYEIGLWGFGFNLFGKDKKGSGREELNDHPYLFMLMNIWLKCWNNQLERFNMKVDEENGKYAGMVNGRARKF